MPQTTPEKARVPAGGDPYALTVDLRRLAESQRTVVPVASTTERASVVSLMTAAGRPPTHAQPLYTHRADAVAGTALEVDAGAGAYTVGAGIRTRETPVTAAGSLSGSVDIGAAQTIPGAPFQGRPFMLSQSAAIRVSIPAGLGAVLELLWDDVAYAEDRVTNGGTSGASFTLKAQLGRRYEGTGSHTMRARLSSLSGGITVVNVGYWQITASPHGAL